MENKQLVSVVMSTYNEPKEWVQLSIESILEQSYNNIEVIIVCDNPNNKEIIELLKKFEEDVRVRVLYNEKNMGLTNSLNKALKFANGEFVARMDSDDISEKDRLLKQYNYLTENNLDLIGGGVICINENEEKISIINNLPKNSELVRKIIIKNSCVPHPTWFGKKNVFHDLNGYRAVNYAEDYDFLLRALAKGFKLGNIDEIVLKYRIRSSSISNSNGLKQFITSQMLINLYKKDKILEDINVINEFIGEELKKIDKSEEINYYEASREFTKGCIGIKKLDFNQGLKIIKGLTKSKYYRKKIWGYIRALL